MNQQRDNQNSKTAYIGMGRTTLDLGDTSLEIEAGRRYNLEPHSEVDRAVKIGALALIEPEGEGHKAGKDLSSTTITHTAHATRVTEKTKSEGEGEK